MDTIPPELLSTLGGGGMVTLFVFAVMSGRLVPRGQVEALMKVIHDRNEQLETSLAEARRQLAEGEQIRTDMAKHLSEVVNQFDDLLEMLNRDQSTIPVSPALPPLRPFTREGR